MVGIVQLPSQPLAVGLGERSALLIHPFTLPQNCQHCNSKVLKAINEYNLSYDFGVLTALNCENCYDHHRAEVACLPTDFDDLGLSMALRDFVDKVDTGCTEPTVSEVMELIQLGGVDF